MSTLDLSPGVREYLLALADDEHIIGARHTSWIGSGPFLEEDLAFCSIAQDELGHAIALYELLTDDIDALGLLRDPAEYRCCELVELPCREWDEALVRHVLYDHAEGLRWQALADSSIPEIVGVAKRARREEAFHVAHADGVLRRVLVAGGDARDRVVAATVRMLPVAATMWTSVDGEAEAVATGVATSSSADLAERWWTEVKVLYEASGVVLDRPAAASGARRTQRSAHFADLHAEIRLVIDLDPNARW